MPHCTAWLSAWDALGWLGLVVVVLLVIAGVAVAMAAVLSLACGRRDCDPACQWCPCGHYHRPRPSQLSGGMVCEDPPASLAPPSNIGQGRPLPPV